MGKAQERQATGAAVTQAGFDQPAIASTEELRYADVLWQSIREKYLAMSRPVSPYWCISAD